MGNPSLSLHRKIAYDQEEEMSSEICGKFAQNLFSPRDHAKRTVLVEWFSSEFLVLEVSEPTPQEIVPSAWASVYG